MSKPFVLELSISDATDENKTLSENLAAKKTKTSIFISKSTAKPKTPKKSSKSAANNTQ